MYIVYTRHKVKDYEQWRKAFDTNATLLKECGITDWWVTQVNGVSTDVAVLVHAPSKRHWDNFVKADMEKMKRTGMDPRETGGLIGDPEWWTGEAM